MKGGGKISKGITKKGLENPCDGFLERMIKMTGTPKNTVPQKSDEKIYSADYLLFHDPDSQEAARRAWRDDNIHVLRRVFSRAGKNIDEIIESVIQECL